MKMIIGFATFLFSFPVISAEKSVTVFHETVDFNLQCEENTDRGVREFVCWSGDISDAAKNHAVSKGGELMNYEIVKAPEGFMEGRYAKNNPLKLKISYLK